MFTKELRKELMVDYKNKEAKTHILVCISGAGGQGSYKQTKEKRTEKALLPAGNYAAFPTKLGQHRFFKTLVILPKIICQVGAPPGKRRWTQMQLLSRQEAGLREDKG